MKHLLFIHGGESFATEQEYKEFLEDTYISWQSEPWTPEKKTSWKEVLAEKVYTGNLQIWMPNFPNKLNAHYDDWKRVFAGILRQFSREDELILIGTSLGGCFLLKYFSECLDFPYQILQMHLVAACLSCGDFSVPENYETLRLLGNKVHIWHAEDDNVVPFSTIGVLGTELPQAIIHAFGSERGYGHFHRIESFPELEQVILSK